MTFLLSRRFAASHFKDGIDGMCFKVCSEVIAGPALTAHLPAAGIILFQEFPPRWCTWPPPDKACPATAKAQKHSGVGRRQIVKFSSMSALDRRCQDCTGAPTEGIVQRFYAARKKDKPLQRLNLFVYYGQRLPRLAEPRLRLEAGGARAARVSNCDQAAL